jgi:hypothetical protein
MYGADREDVDTTSECGYTNRVVDLVGLTAS